MSNKFESLLELLINEENEKAEALFHEIVVEKSRDIYENLADGEVKAEAKEEAPSTEIDKTIDELAAKGVDKIDAKILKFNFGNACAYIKNTLARGKGVVNVMQEQLRSAPTTAVDYILGNEKELIVLHDL